MLNQAAPCPCAFPLPHGTCFLKSLQAWGATSRARRAAPRRSTPCPASGRRGVRAPLAAYLPGNTGLIYAETHGSPQRQHSAATVGAAAGEAVRRTRSCCSHVTTTPGSSVRSTRQITRSPYGDVRGRRAGHAGGRRCRRGRASPRRRAGRAASPASLGRPAAHDVQARAPLGGQLIPLVSSSLRSLAYAACSPRPACPPGPPRSAG